MRVCTRNSDGRLLEAQSGGTGQRDLDVLVTNMIAGGYTSDQVTARYATDAEYSVLIPSAQPVRPQYANLSGGFTPVHGNVGLSSPMPPVDVNVISISPVNAGGLLVKDPTINRWGFVDFIAQNNITGDRRNCYLNNVAGQVLARNTFYHVGVKFVEGAPVINFTTGGHNKTPDTFVEVPIIRGEMDHYTSLVGFCYTLDDSFEFNPLAGRSVVSNWFPLANQFGIQTPQKTVSGISSTTWVKLDPTGVLDTHLVHGPSFLFWAEAIGYAYNDTPGNSCSMKIVARQISPDAQDSNGNESVMISASANAAVPVVSNIALPFAAGYTRFEIWVKVSGGSGTFVVQNKCLALSA